MHIAFLSCDRASAGVFDRDTALIGALETAGVKVSVVVPQNVPSRLAERVRAALMHRLGFNVFSACDPPRLRQVAAAIEKALSGIKAEVVLSRSTHFTAWLNTPLPMVNWVDAVFDCLVGFYPYFIRLDPISARAGHRAEERALNRSDLTLLKSRWAVGKTIRRYRVPETRLGVVQPTANLPQIPSRSEALSRQCPRGNHLRCLLVGDNWHRKGADIALQAVQKTRDAGFEVTLTTMGLNAPSDVSAEPWLKVLPQLRKGISTEYAKFCQEFLDADVFLLPSRADFTPNVICEAYAFGLPAIGSPAGAIPEMIEHGQTGFVTQRVEDADEYARFLIRLTTEPGLLSRMAVESRNKYEAEFALPVVAGKLVAYLERTLSQTSEPKWK